MKKTLVSFSMSLEPDPHQADRPDPDPHQN